MSERMTQYNSITTGDISTVTTSYQDPTTCIYTHMYTGWSPGSHTEHCT